MNKVLQNGERFHFKVTKNKSITAAKFINLMKCNRMNNQQKLKCALIWFVHVMLLAKDPSKKVDLHHIKMTADLEFFEWYPWGKESFELTLSYLKKKTDLTKQKKAFIKGNNVTFGFMRPFLISKGTPQVVGFFPAHCPSSSMEHAERYMKIFKPYTDEVKDTSIGALKEKLKGVTVMTSSAEVANEDEDLGGHHYVPSPPRACDHAGSSGLKTLPNTSNGDDLRGHVAFLEKSLLNITSFVRDERLRRIEKNKKKQREEVHLDSSRRSRHQVNLKELAVAVTNIVAADEKGEEEKKEEEIEEENATDKQDAK
ncbi:hypothetical protein FXO38_06938 [Capsicum annuum]|nr:hypothetical protein FXO38_06938 [Capsicum annuum]